MSDNVSDATRSRPVRWGLNQAIAFKDFTEPSDSKLMKDGPELERLADLYALMIGADPGSPEPPMIDVTPERSSPAPRSDRMRRQLDDTKRRLDALVADASEEQAPPRPQPPRQRLVRRPQR